MPSSLNASLVLARSIAPVLLVSNCSNIFLKCLRRSSTVFSFLSRSCSSFAAISAARLSARATFTASAVPVREVLTVSVVSGLSAPREAGRPLALTRGPVSTSGRSEPREAGRLPALSARLGLSEELSLTLPALRREFPSAASTEPKSTGLDILESESSPAACNLRSLDIVRAATRQCATAPRSNLQDEDCHGCIAMLLLLSNATAPHSKHSKTGRTVRYGQGLFFLLHSGPSS
jgi:hypothetical protein